MAGTATKDITSTARDFFEACETGQGWEVCREWCREDATFSAQSDALADVTTLRGYCDWMKGLLGPLPDGRYELMGFAADEKRNCVIAAAVFHGTHTAEGGPVPPTGNTVAADYVYLMQFEGGRIRHMTKVWNDTWSRRALGWL
jgi:predicted ester cyclase